MITLTNKKLVKKALSNSLDSASVNNTDWFLFGSLQSGTIAESSDIDLCVCFRATGWQEYKKVFSYLHMVHTDLDSNLSQNVVDLFVFDYEVLPSLYSLYPEYINEEMFNKKYILFGSKLEVEKSNHNLIKNRVYSIAFEALALSNSLETSLIDYNSMHSKKLAKKTDCYFRFLMQLPEYKKLSSEFRQSLKLLLRSTKQLASGIKINNWQEWINYQYELLRSIEASKDTINQSLVKLSLDQRIFHGTLRELYNHLTLGTKDVFSQSFSSQAIENYTNNIIKICIMSALSSGIIEINDFLQSSTPAIVKKSYKIVFDYMDTSVVKDYTDLFIAALCISQYCFKISLEEIC